MMLDAPAPRRGFAAIPKEQRHATHSKGGKTAHARGTAREWTRDEAKYWGSKGGAAPRHVAKPAD